MKSQLFILTYEAVENVHALFLSDIVCHLSPLLFSLARWLPFPLLNYAKHIPTSGPFARTILLPPVLSSRSLEGWFLLATHVLAHGLKEPFPPDVLMLVRDLHHPIPL